MRKFLLKKRRPWNYDEVGYDTFEIDSDLQEHDAKSPIYSGLPLTEETFPIYLKKHRGDINKTIRKLCAAEGRHVKHYGPGEYAPAKLFEITGGFLTAKLPYPELAPHCTYIIIGVSEEPLCTFDDHGHMELPTD